MATFPERALALLNAALTWLFDLAIAPAARLAPMTTLLAVSAATGLAMLWVVGRTSNQRGIAAAKRDIQAGLFEIRLFNDDPRAVIRALGRVLGRNARYLGFSLVPLMWVALPLTLVVAQLQAFYGYEGLTPGQPVLVTMRLDQARVVQADAAAAAIEANGSIRVATPTIVLPGANEVLWRVVPAASGDTTVTLILGSARLTKTMQVSGETVRRSPLRVTGLVNQLLYPSEPPLPTDVPVVEVAVPFREATLSLFGWQVHWLVVYVLVSMATAFAFAKRWRVVL